MDDQPYLLELTRRLGQRLAAWPDEQKDALARFVLARQDAGGGFAGRAGPADLYYTAFALRCLAMLNRLDEPVRRATAGFLESQAPESIIDLVSYLYARRATAAGDGLAAKESEALAQRLERFRGPDGGYGKTPGASASSTYHTFLAFLCYDLLGSAPPEGRRIGPFILQRRRDDGGFAELAVMPRSSVSPTAAAAALTIATGVADETTLRGAARFLLEAQRPDGGFPASPRVPASDLLSTFTALLTLSDGGQIDLADRPACERFVRACQRQDAGFAGTPHDSQADVEYTFYGAGCLALLQPG